MTITWVFNVKTDGDGEVERYKARLSVRGFEQREEVYFHEVLLKKLSGGPVSWSLFSEGLVVQVVPPRLGQ